MLFILLRCQTKLEVVGEFEFVLLDTTIIIWKWNEARASFEMMRFLNAKSYIKNIQQQLETWERKIKVKVQKSQNIRLLFLGDLLNALLKMKTEEKKLLSIRSAFALRIMFFSLLIWCKFHSFSSQELLLFLSYFFAWICSLTCSLHRPRRI